MYDELRRRSGGQDQLGLCYKTSNQKKQRTFTKSRDMNCGKVVGVFGCRLSRRWPRIRGKILGVGACLIPSPALAADSHGSSYRTGAHTQFVQRIRISEKHVESVV